MVPCLIRTRRVCSGMRSVGMACPGNFVGPLRETGEL